MSTRLIKRIEACFNRIAPKFLADNAWDNVGTIVESPLESGPNVLLTIDYSEEVFKEAVEKRAGVVIAYHPPWFKSCKRLTLDSDERVLLNSIASGVSIYSPHTVASMT